MARGRSFVYRAAGYVAFLLLAFTCWRVDAYLKQWPDNGLALDGELVISSSDWPAFWRGALRTPTGRALEQTLRRPGDGLERTVRLAAGIRPTPLRWSIWLGPRAVLSKQGEQWVLCSRPGILLRGLAALEAVWPKTPGAVGDPEVAHAWHDGYLLVSRFPLDVRALAGVASSEVPGGTPSVQFRWATARDGASCTVLATEDIPLQLDFSGPGLGPPPPLHEPAPVGGAIYQDAALLQWSASPTGRRLLDVLPGVTHGVASLPPLEAILRQPLPHALEQAWNDAPRDWERRSLLGFDADAVAEVFYTGRSVHRPEGAWPAHPLAVEVLSPGLGRIPYEWSGHEGFLLPVLGADYTFGCALQGAWAHAANPPANLTKLLMEDGAAAARGAPSLTLVVQWKAFAGPLGKLLRTKRWTDRLGVEPQAFETVVQPWLDALAVLGRGEIHSVDVAGNVWRLEGKLCAAAEGLP